MKQPTHPVRTWPRMLAALLVLALLPLAAVQAQSRAAPEASMRVLASIDILRDGTLAGYRLHRPERLPEPVRQIVEREIQQWTFAPLPFLPSEDAVHVTEARIHLRALRESPQGYRIEVDGVSFEQPDVVHRDFASGEDGGRQPRPGYPHDAVLAGVSAATYLAMKFDEDGRILDAAVMQTNLHTAIGRAQGNHLRGQLERSVLAAVRQWRLAPGANDAGKDYATGILTIEFCIEGTSACERGRDRYGEWTPYLPGPRREPDWLSPAQRQVVVNTLSGEELFTGGDSVTLLNPPTASHR